jgi:hypothetical protein
MMKMSYVMGSMIIGFCLVFHSVAQAADVPQPKQLSDAQLDKIVAASVPTVSAVGDGSATGQLSFAETSVTSAASTGGQSVSTASGQATAVGISSAGPLAGASSHLSLMVGYF